MQVLKFGGSSVRNAEAIRNVFSIIVDRNDKCVVVVSAFQTVTNTLVELIKNIGESQIDLINQNIQYLKELHIKTARDLNIGKEVVNFIENELNRLSMLCEAMTIIGEVSKKSQDIILSIGERLSSFIIANAASISGINATHLDSSKIISTNDKFTEAEVDFERTKDLSEIKLLPLLDDYNVVICGGFIGSTANGEITTLGRGGSDYSAAIIASSINASRLDIYTDVDGIMTCDPNSVPRASLIDKMSYSEAAELAFFGAKVLHPKTISPAVSKNIPVRVLNTFNPTCSGTEIVDIKSGQPNLKALAYRKGITVINIISNRMLGAYGFLSKVFEIFNKYKTSVDIVTTSEVSVTLTIDCIDNVQSILPELEKFAAVEVFKDKAMISIIGEGLRNTSGIGAKFFGVLKDINISMISFGASEINLSIVIDEHKLKTAIELLHKEFFENNRDNI